MSGDLACDKSLAKTVKPIEPPRVSSFTIERLLAPSATREPICDREPQPILDSSIASPEDIDLEDVCSTLSESNFGKFFLCLSQKDMHFVSESAG